MNKGEFIPLKKYVDEGRSGEILKEFNDLVKANSSLKALLDLYKENKEIFEYVDELESITGMSREELEGLDLQEGLELIKEKLQQQPPRVPALSNFTPNNYVIPNNKLANSLHKMNFDEITELIVDTKRGIISPVMLNYDDENIEIEDKDKKFTPQDRAVHNAICSILESGSAVFTPERIYRVVNGLKERESVSPQAVESIRKMIDRMNRIKVEVDYTNEANDRSKTKAEKLKKFTIKGQILVTEEITINAGGHDVMGYRLGKKPLIYEYSQFTNQVITVPSELLNTKDIIRTTPDVIAIREYLIRRIEVMKHDEGQINKIKFTTLFEEIGQPGPTKEKSKKIRDNVMKLLEKYKSEKYIKNFNLYKIGRAYGGVEIFY